MHDTDQLMIFQEFFMQALYDHHDVKILQEQLKKYPCDPILKEWLLSITPSMLEVAARMIQRWGKKSMSS